MIDYWQDYKPSNDGKMPSIPSMRSIDAKRIRAYCEATGVDRDKQPINAKFMNEMEEWYLNLAEQYSALDKIRAEIEQITDTMGVSYNQYVSKIDVLEIIDKYKAESEKSK